MVGRCRGSISRLLVAAAVVVVVVVLSVTVVGIVPLQLKFRLVSTWYLSLHFLLPWPWRCGPSGWGTPPCCGRGSLAYSPTQRSCVRAHWCTGSSCRLHSFHLNQVWEWEGGPEGRQGRPWGRQRPSPPIKMLLPAIAIGISIRHDITARENSPVCASLWQGSDWAGCECVSPPYTIQMLRNPPSSLQRSFGDLALYQRIDGGRGC